MILQIRYLAHLEDLMDTILEAVLSWIIQSIIVDTLTPLRASIDTLTTRVETCYGRQGRLQR